MPAFFGQAGERSENLAERSALLQLQPQTKSEKPDRIPLAEKLEDRVAYQQMRNEDLSMKGGSRYKDQGILFSMDGKIIDEMRRLYQLSLKVAAAPGGDPGDDGDDESDEPPKHHP